MKVVLILIMLTSLLSSVSSFAVEEHINIAKSGEVTFDYSNNNGHYIIGKGSALFELKFSSASNGAIHVYNDPKSINKIALAYAAVSFSDIGNANLLDYSSRSRTPRTNEVVVLVNQQNYFEAIKH